MEQFNMDVVCSVVRVYNEAHQQKRREYKFNWLSDYCVHTVTVYHIILDYVTFWSFVHHQPGSEEMTWNR